MVRLDARKHKKKWKVKERIKSRRMGHEASSPTECLKFLGLAVGDIAEWIFVENEGRKEVILRKKEVSE